MTDLTKKVISDTVSNVGTGGKWTMPGSSGVSVLGTTVNSPAQSNLVSAYRNIDYTKVTGTHKLMPNNQVDTAENRKRAAEGYP